MWRIALRNLTIQVQQRRQGSTQHDIIETRAGKASQRKIGSYKIDHVFVGIKIKVNFFCLFSTPASAPFFCSFPDAARLLVSPFPSFIENLRTAICIVVQLQKPNEGISLFTNSHTRLTDRVRPLENHSGSSIKSIVGKLGV